MAEDFTGVSGPKEAQYQHVLATIRGVLEGEPDLIANLANISAILKAQFNWLWVGFYLVKGNELVLGPFQGPLACTRIKLGKGVCGSAWAQAKTLMVPNVDEFPGHIACSSLSKSEIVVPIIRNGQVVAVLDADSEHLNYFDDTDRKYLEAIVTQVTFTI
jgi:GAF domain-containing protein